MVTVTDRAKEELRRILETKSLEPGRCLRLAVPPVWTGGGDFGIVIDDETQDDYVASLQGTKVLLMDAGLMERLASAVLDFKESPQGEAFTLDVY